MSAHSSAHPVLCSLPAATRVVARCMMTPEYEQITVSVLQEVLVRRDGRIRLGGGRAPPLVIVSLREAYKKQSFRKIRMARCDLKL